MTTGNDCHCKTCKHWQPRHELRMLDWGTCGTITYTSKIDTPDVGDAVFKTTSDFGCVLWEGLEDDC